jgi:hypothetical protein
VAEKNSWPFPLLSYVQGDAISIDVVFLEQGAVGASTTARFSHWTQQQASTNGSPSREDSTARNSWPRTQICFPVCCDGGHALLSLKLMMVPQFISCESVFQTVSLFITEVLSLST